MIKIIDPSDVEEIRGSCVIDGDTYYLEWLSHDEFKLLNSCFCRVGGMVGFIKFDEDFYERFGELKRDANEIIGHRKYVNRKPLYLGFSNMQDIAFCIDFCLWSAWGNLKRADELKKLLAKFQDDVYNYYLDMSKEEILSMLVAEDSKRIEEEYEEEVLSMTITEEPNRIVE